MEPQAEHDRSNLLRESMPFLHALIYSKIEGANRVRANNRLNMVSRDIGNGKGGEQAEGGGDRLEEFAEGLEGISHSVVMDVSELDTHRLEQVRETLNFNIDPFF